MGEERNGVTTEASTEVSPEAMPAVQPVRDPPLLEREHELEQIARALASARRGAGETVVIEAPAGIGKTSLLREAASVGGSEGMRVLLARGGELERDFAFGVVRQLLEPVLARASVDQRSRLLGGSAALARPVLAPPAPLADSSSDPTHAVLHGLYWLVANLAERASLLIAIDDFHWADGPSQRFVLHLCRRLGSLPVTVLLTTRSGEARDQAELSAALMLEVGPTVILRPEGLSLEATALLAEARLGGPAGAELAYACHEATGGNPFLLGEVLQELRGYRRPAAEIDPQVIRRLGPARIAAAILFRVGRGHPDAPALARAIAVLGDGASLSRAAALAGVDRPAAAELVDLLREAAVLQPGDELRFAHPVVRTAIYEEMRGGDRAALHARAAQLLAGEGAEPQQVALHLLAVQPAGSPAVVLALREAARIAVASGAPETAVRYLRRAVEEFGSEAVPADLLCELGSAAVRAGQADGLAILRRAFALADGGRQRAVAGLALGVTLLRTGTELEEAIDVFEHALDAADDPQHVSSLEAMLLLAGITTPALRARASERLARARQEASADVSDRARPLLSSLSLDVLVSDGDVATAVRLAERALGGDVLIREEIGTDMPVASPAVLALALGGRLRAAERTLGDAISCAGARGSPLGAARALAFRAFVRHRIGELAGAEADARACLELAPESRRGIPQPLAAATLAAIQLEQADPDGARATLGTLDAATYDPEVVPIQPVREVRAKLRIAEGEATGALEELLACERWEQRWQARAGVVPVAWRSAAALATASLGDGARGRELASQELQLARRFGTPGPVGVALRALGLIGGGEHGVELLSEAVAMLGRSERRLEHARALVDLGAALRRCGRRSVAIERLREGLDAAQRCTATALARRARQELQVAGARPGRAGVRGQALTAAERRVAELAAGGMSNKRIAASLFVTLRTVEMHLSSVYRKLGISARDQLPTALVDR